MTVKNTNAVEAGRVRGPGIRNFAVEYETSFIVFCDYVIECEIYGGNIETPPVVDFMCPRCGGQLKIDGEHKTITIERFPERIFRFPNGEFLPVTNRLTIAEPITCPTPSVCGKHICGLRMKVTDGKANPV